MRPHGICLVLTFCGSVAMGASRDDGSFATDGIGTEGCGAFATAYDDQDEALLGVYGSWTEGFMTGVNVFAEGVYDITPWQTTPLLLAKLNQFCRQNRETAFVVALGRLVGSLQPDAQTTPSPLAQIRVDDRAVTLPTETFGLIADALSLSDAVSEDRIDVDAISGALRDFQSREGLDETGLPDQITLDRLLRP